MMNFNEYYASMKKQANKKADELASQLERQGRTEELMAAAQDAKKLEQLYREFNIA